LAMEALITWVKAGLGKIDDTR